MSQLSSARLSLEVLGARIVVDTSLRPRARESCIMYEYTIVTNIPLYTIVTSIPLYYSY